ncbi:AAA family ATPase [Brevibacterium sp. 5221]|uniref:AAA family ATPase n=1 Tax=Brevibacterium rongguiense TaxID=2695267 RepID=A0A6N9HBM5_9MICO|nr:MULTISPECIES: ATP-binding protein [Brevibacterium]MYM20962.1 AAA family ATPase [Brevibacterium rongguiense]WAL39523.1 ATP-binding protein [Brevibacterium sp. BRM-1]
MPIATYDTVLINGSVGTGKTTTAEALGDEVKQRGIPGAVIDVDWLRRSWPSPAGDPFRTALALENMQAITANFRRAGARLIVVATVVETVEQLERTACALASRRMLHVRLTASSDAVLSRLTRRHHDDEAALRWHAQRHPELANILDQAGFTDDLQIDTTDKSVANVTHEIITAIIT